MSDEKIKHFFNCIILLYGLTWKQLTYLSRKKPESSYLYYIALTLENKNKAIRKKANIKTAEYKERGIISQNKC